MNNKADIAMNLSRQKPNEQVLAEYSDYREREKDNKPGNASSNLVTRSQINILEEPTKSMKEILEKFS